MYTHTHTYIGRQEDKDMNTSLIISKMEIKAAMKLLHTCVCVSQSCLTL